jgi:hypothetical protein
MLIYADSSVDYIGQIMIFLRSPKMMRSGFLYPAVLRYLFCKSQGPAAKPNNPQSDG